MSLRDRELRAIWEAGRITQFNQDGGVMGYYQRDFSVPDARVDNWSLRGAKEE